MIFFVLLRQAFHDKCINASRCLFAVVILLKIETSNQVQYQFKCVINPDYRNKKIKYVVKTLSEAEFKQFGFHNCTYEYCTRTNSDSFTKREARCKKNKGSLFRFQNFFVLKKLFLKKQIITFGEPRSWSYYEEIQLYFT